MCCLCSVSQWCLLVTRAWGKVTCCPVSPEMSSTWRVRAPSEWSLPRAASKWTARRWRLRSGIQPARSATVPSHQREYKGGRSSTPVGLLFDPSRRSDGVWWRQVLLSVHVSWLQVLPRGCWCSPGLWHRQASNLRECGALAEGAERSRWQQHRHHAGGQQERPASPPGCSHRWGAGLRW